MSGEGVALQLPHAGIGSRLVATLIDFVVQFVGGIAVILLTAVVAGGGDSAAATAVIIVEFVLIAAGYPIVLEWLNHGRTLGKLALGLRVVRDDGGPISFRQALVRGLSSLVLEKPGIMFPVSTSAGLITALFNGRNKRLGDLMAGTFVVYERGGPRRAAAPQLYVVPQHLYGWAQALDLSRVDDRLALAVRQFVVRANEMTPDAQLALGEGLRAQLQAVIAPPPPPGTPTPWVLTTVLAERRRRAELAAASAPAMPAGLPSPLPPRPAPAPPAPPAGPPRSGFQPPA